MCLTAEGCHGGRGAWLAAWHAGGCGPSIGHLIPVHSTPPHPPTPPHPTPACLALLLRPCGEHSPHLRFPHQSIWLIISPCLALSRASDCIRGPGRHTAAHPDRGGVRAVLCSAQVRLRVLANWEACARHVTPDKPKPQLPSRGMREA